MIRAAVVNIPVGNFRPELLSAGHAIIHDKIVVIDPCDAENCAVITGSHNLGYRASYCNDDNLLIVRGNRALAIAYAVHVLDLYDHYVFRARLQQDLREQLKAGTIHSIDEAAQADPHGLLAARRYLPRPLFRRSSAAVRAGLLPDSRRCAEPDLKPRNQRRAAGTAIRTGAIQDVGATFNSSSELLVTLDVKDGMLPWWCRSEKGS
jgi:phosphatidylserine/phosphatidylglycerophosphate/cardiolipin synthase-like enzyme